MGTSSATRVVDGATTFKNDLTTGVPIDDALHAVYEAGSNPEVLAAATEMLAVSGSIDMKRLAREVGMSRASLYRHYPDRWQLESEVAATGVEGIAAALAGESDRVGKLRAIGEYLIDNPGHAAAMVPIAASVSVDVIRTGTEALTGAATDAAWILGFLVIAATPGREEPEVAAMRAHLEESIAALV